MQYMLERLSRPCIACNQLRGSMIERALHDVVLLMFKFAKDDHLIIGEHSLPREGMSGVTQSTQTEPSR